MGGRKIRKTGFAAHPILGNSEKKEIQDVLETGLLSGFIAAPGEFFLGGPKVRKLEADFEKYFSVEYAVAVNSATAGLHTAVAASGVGPGDEVIVSPYTMSASATAIVMANAIPVFADIEEETFCIDPEKIKKKITSRTKAIILVHLFGQMADMSKIMKIARKHKLIVIEDAAQAIGATYKEKYAGTIGNVGIYSLNQHKTITTGEGGVLVTNDRNIAEKARFIRNHGEVIVDRMDYKDITNTVGWNYRMTELEAAVGIAQFRKLNFLNSYRIELAEYFTDLLTKEKFPGIEIPMLRSHNRHVYFSYPLKFKKDKIGISRETFIKAIQAEGVSFGAGYVRPIYMEPMYQKRTAYGAKGCPFKCPFYKGKVFYKKGLCPIAEKMHYKELISTGLFRYPLKKKDIKDIFLTFKKIFDNIEDLKKYERMIS